MPVKVRLATIADAEVIEPWLRSADVDELIAASGPDILGQLVDAIAKSRGRLGRMAFAAERDGKVISLFGFVPAGAVSSVAHPWMVATPDVERIPGMLKKLATSYCSAALEQYPELVNYVDARNKVSIRWLQSLGFKVHSPPAPFGVAGMPFHRFDMRG